MTALKPCPFCGSTPRLPDGSDKSCRSVWVTCSNYQCLVVGPSAKTCDDAVAKWNTRPGEAALCASIARFERECDALWATIHRFQQGETIESDYLSRKDLENCGAAPEDTE